MHPTALLLVLGAAVAHAAWNLSSKRASASGPIFVWLTSVVASVIFLPLGVWSVLTQPMPWLPLLVAGVVSGLIHVLYFVSLQRGYAVGDLSVVYPLARGSGPALSVLLAVILLGERPGIWALGGAAVIVAGIVVIAVPQRRPAAPIGERRGSLGGGIGFGLLTGLMIAAYTLWDAYAVTALAVPVLGFMSVTAISEVLLLSPLALRDRPRVRRIWVEHRREVLIVAVLSPVSYLLVLFAFQLAPVSSVAPARELSVVLVSLAGTLLLGEPGRVRRLSGAVIVVVGVVLLALA